MARLRGLASEHHPQGPGDAPRGRKGRKKKTVEVEVNTTSTTITETSTASIAGTKRPASPSVEVQPKHAKRVQLDDEVQLSREMGESVSRSQHADSNNSPRFQRFSANRRHSDPFGAPGDNQDDGQPISNSQPTGLSRAARRARMSMPAQLHIAEADETDGAQQVQFAPLSDVLDGPTRRRLRRNHLSEEMNDIEAHKKEDAKLRKDYAHVRHQLSLKEEAIRNLEYQLEANRLGSINMSEDQTAKLQRDLDDARGEIEELRASSPYAARGAFAGNGELDDYENDLMLVEHEERAISQDQPNASPISNGFYASRALEATQITVDSLSSISETTRDALAEASQADPNSVPDKISDMAVKRYEAEIEGLLHKLADSQGALRCVTLELQNMNIISPGATAAHILKELRRVFENSRDEYENLFSRELVGVNNAEFIKVLMDDLKGMNTELLEKTLLAENQNQRIVHVESQYERTMGLLAESEALTADLEENKTTLEARLHDVEGALQESENQYNRMSEIAEQRLEQIEDQDATIHGLKDEIEDKDTSLERITQAVEQYRKDVQTLTDTVTRLEREHAEHISQMEQDHNEVVEDLQTRLDSEMADRAEAESDAKQKGDYIDELQERMAALDRDVDDINNKVAELAGRLAEEEKARETAENLRDEHAELADEHANTIENLKETIKELEDQIAQFRINLDAERNQRQQTEEDLDTANQKIETLTTQLHDHGLQANELRSKLFQVQQEKEATVAELKEKAKAREEELTERLEEETRLRQEAEHDISTLEARIASLEQDLATTEDGLQKMKLERDTLEADRDQQVETLNQQLEDLRQKYTALETSSKSSIDTLQATITDLNNEIGSLRATITDLEASAAEAQKQHALELAERDDTIGELQSELVSARKDIESLSTENNSLAKRVENEANELLNIVSSHGQEVEALRATISHQNAHIADLKAAAEQQAKEYAEEITSKMREIEERTIVGQTRAENIVLLESQLEEVKERFRIQVEDSQNTIAALLETNRLAVARQEELAAETQKRAADALKAVSEMKVKGLEVKTNGVNLKKVVNGKVTKVSDKVKISKKTNGRKSSRLRDSGFVEFNDDEDLQAEMADEGVVE